jgi:RNA polymerase sigma-70 factor (ECF subfamily)
MDPRQPRLPVDDGGSWPATAVSEEDLIQAAARGDQEAYGELVRRYSATAHRAAVLITGPADAEDAVQEAFVRAFYALTSFRQGAPFKPWLLTIVKNCARNKTRSHLQQARLKDRLTRSQPPSPTFALQSVPSAEATALGAEDHSQLITALASLSDSARLVITCRYLLELSEAETAQVLGWPVGTVKSRLSRALDRLRAKLDKPPRPPGTRS